MSDAEFWGLIETVSEPPGTFGISDNFVSNEPRVAENARFLHPAGGVYIGVGPEQNFSYIARLRPTMAVIVDIRRENRNLHLLYKALFELSSDRVDFVSHLFSRPVPAGLASGAGVEEIFNRVDRVAPSAALLAATTSAVYERLIARHGFPLQQTDIQEIDRALKAFCDDGPAIQFWGSRAVDRDTVRPSYRQLMTMPDFTGQTRSFLSGEDEFGFVKDLHARNMIVPVVGDFGGDGALPRVASYVREHRDVVRAFYASNVGVYLTTRQARAFCRNLGTLPASYDASFVESDTVRALASKLKACEAERK